MLPAVTAPAPARRVLVVEDDVDVRLVTRDALEDAGYKVDAAENGAAALRTLREEPHTPDVILLDLMMPVLDGWGFLAQRELDPRLRQIPVVVVSALPPAQMDLRGRAQGCLRKPTDLDDLIETLARVASGAEATTRA